MKEHSSMVDWRVIRPCIVLVKLLLCRINVSREVMLKHSETRANLTLCEVVDYDNLAYCRRR